MKPQRLYSELLPSGFYSLLGDFGPAGTWRWHWAYKLPADANATLERLASYTPQQWSDARTARLTFSASLPFSERPYGQLRLQLAPNSSQPPVPSQEPRS